MSPDEVRAAIAQSDLAEPLGALIDDRRLKIQCTAVSAAEAFTDEDGTIHLVAPNLAPNAVQAGDALNATTFFRLIQAFGTIQLRSVSGLVNSAGNNFCLGVIKTRWFRAAPSPTTHLPMSFDDFTDMREVTSPISCRSAKTYRSAASSSRAKHVAAAQGRQHHRTVPHREQRGGQAEGGTVVMNGCFFRATALPVRSSRQTTPMSSRPTLPEIAATSRYRTAISRLSILTQRLTGSPPTFGRVHQVR